MTTDDVRAPIGALEREGPVDLAGVVVQLQALGGAVEHVLDVLEAVLEERPRDGIHVEEARALLECLW